MSVENVTTQVPETENVESMFSNDAENLAQTDTDDGIDTASHLDDGIDIENVDENAKQLYTPDEMRNLDWQNIDTSRIPDEMQPFYKAMQASYTKKRQAEVEQLKKLSEQSVQQAIPPLDSDLFSFQQAQTKANEYLKLNAPNFDTADPRYQLALNKITNDFLTADKQKSALVTNAKTEMNNAIQKYGDDFQTVDSIAQNILINEYPASIVDTIKKAVANGNFAPVNELHRLAYERMNAGKSTNTQPQATTKQVAPPNSVSAGSKNGSTDYTKSLFGY